MVSLFVDEVGGEQRRKMSADHFWPPAKQTPQQDKRVMYENSKRILLHILRLILVLPDFPSQSCGCPFVSAAIPPVHRFSLQLPTRPSILVPLWLAGSTIGKNGQHCITTTQEAQGMRRLSTKTRDLLSERVGPMSSMRQSWRPLYDNTDDPQGASQEEESFT